MSLNHNQLQKPIVKRLSPSAETEVYVFSFFSFAPLILARLSLRCLFQNRNNQNIRFLEWRITDSQSASP